MKRSSMSSKLVLLLLSLFLINLLAPVLFSHFVVEAGGSQQRTLLQENSVFPSSSTTGVGSRSSSKPLRRAVAHFVDSPTYMYGVYSIKNQLKRFAMTAKGVEQVAVVPNDFPELYPDEFSVLTEWLGASHVTQVDKMFLHNQLDGGLWKGTFNKLWLFNLTDYDQLIVLDSDILVRKSILHWFDYPTPCATQSPEDPVTWNSGAMVIQPSATVFQEMLDVLPQVRAPNADNSLDTWMGTSNTDQNFLSAFFTQSHYRVHTMPSYSSVISSKLVKGKYQYWADHRKELLETVHFTSVKPWKKFATNQKILCGYLREWKESLQGIEEYAPKLPLIPFDCTRNCPQEDKEEARATTS